MGYSRSASVVIASVRQALRSTSREKHLTVQDEPRRSSRANKGSNSDRWQEVLDSARHNIVGTESIAGDTATDAGTVQTEGYRERDNTDDADPDDEIRCVCGQTSEVEDEDKDFVQCDSCHVWQHNQCVGLPIDIPEDQDYFCEQCRPDLHEKLLKDIANGKKFGKTQDDKKRKRSRSTSAKDIKARSSRTDTSNDTSQMTEAPFSPKRHRSSSVSSDMTIMSDNSDPIVGRRRASTTANTKSKTRAKASQSRTANPRNKPSKPVKMGGKSKSTFNGPFGSLNEIMDPDRRKIAAALIKLMGDTFKIATDTEGFVSSDDVSVDRAALSLGLQIEFAMFDAQLEPKAKFRQLSFNLKDPKNPSLRKNVLDHTLSPAELVQMSSEDMANPELKAKTEALREESLKQSVLVQETGPRIRRTHKGEEYIEAPDLVPAESDSATVVQNTRTQVQEGDGSPVSVRSFSTQDSSTSSPESPKPQRHERANSNFDIKNVWTHIESPADSDQPLPPQRRESRSASFPQSDDNDNDEDLLGLLEDGQKKSPPFNYASHEAVWNGQLLMPGVSDMTASVTPLGGPRRFDIDWASALTACIKIDGRISKPDASKYLCHQKYSQSKTVFALRIQPQTGKEAAFNTLYSYFIKKDRYGVIKPGKTRLRDGYIVPLPTNADLPEFITMLPSFNLPSDRTDMLLAVLVVEKDASPATSGPPVPAASPIKSVEPPAAAAIAAESRNIQSPSTVPPISPPAVQSFRAHQWQTHQGQYGQAPTSSGMLPQHQSTPPISQQAYAHHGQYQQQQQQHQARPAPDYLQMQARPPSHSPMPPQLDQNAQAVLMAFLRAHPEVANNTQIISSPQLMASLLDAFVREGGMARR